MNTPNPKHNYLFLGTSDHFREKLDLDASTVFLAMSDEQILSMEENNILDYIIHKITPKEIILEKPTVDKPHKNNFTRQIEITVYVNYTGDRNFFMQSVNIEPIMVNYLNDTSFSFTVSVGINEINKVENIIEILIKTIKEKIDIIKQSNNNILKTIRETMKYSIQKRKKEIVAIQKLTETLPYEIHRIENKSIDIIVPEKKTITPLPKEIAPKQIDPYIEDKVYKEILQDIANMSIQMEKTPNTFCDLQETQLRDFFLVSLNMLYPGKAMGETFNKKGKTDILIPHNGKNLFIAECKFWQGEKGLIDTIDQLLGYVSWRDQKTAILLFNRNKGFSKVLEQIPTIVSSHKNFLQELDKTGESWFNFNMKNEDDKDRIFKLAILAFDIPKKEE